MSAFSIARILKFIKFIVTIEILVSPIFTGISLSSNQSHVGCTTDAINDGRGVPILVRQVACLNNVVEHGHRAIRRVTKPMLNFASSRFAGSVLAGIEQLHMIRKGQFAIDRADGMSFAEQFSALAELAVQFERQNAASGNSAIR